MLRILVTGAAGFIGYHLCTRLVADGYHVVGLDNLNDYYDVGLKKARLEQLLSSGRCFEFHKVDICDLKAVESRFAEARPETVFHLAAQAGVRYSLENPQAYIDSNITGFLNILECCRRNNTGHLMFASSSSVYGANTKMPFSVRDNVDHPISLYAATKKANELMAHSYSHLYGIPVTGLRFFTVYGPWGRPDMAIFAFTKAILEGKPIRLFNFGRMKRDFTYVDDVVEVLVRLITLVPQGTTDWFKSGLDPSIGPSPYRLYNVGNGNPVDLARLVTALENSLGRKAATELVPMQLGDVPETYADIGDLAEKIGFRPCTEIEQGIEQFARWYRVFYGV